MSEARRWFNSREAGEYFGRIPRKTMLSLASRGKFPRGSVIRLGYRLLFDVEAIEAAKVFEPKGRP
jgi:hypothetical protein